MGKQKNFIRKLAGFERDIPDPYNKGFYTHLEMFVPKPTADKPYPCIIISIRNGHQKLFFRVSSLEEINRAFRVPKDAKVRMKAALAAANAECDRLEEDARLLFAKRRLVSGEKIVNNRTGEVLAEAAVSEFERIVKRGTNR
jgi:hypothetical protein